MKKLATSIMLGVMIFAAAGVQARNVSEAEAREAAAYYFSHNSDRSVKAADLTLVNQIDNMELGVAELYMYNVKDGGWIIMTGSTVIDAVMAYSEDSELPSTYTDLPANMRWWVEGYADLVGEAQAAELDEKLPDGEEWTRLFEKTLSTSPKVDFNLMETKWDQGNPYRPTYNELCPTETINGNTLYCYTGCVATAMAQIIRYWGTPIRPVGSKNYTSHCSLHGINTNVRLRFDTIRFDYSKMPVALTSQNGTVYSYVTHEDIYQVALLSYACGVAVKMDYDAVDGSGASSEDVPNAFYTHFRYSIGVKTNRYGPDDTSFVGKLRRNLINKCPVYMSGASSTGNDAHAAGHAWVCSGYRADTTASVEKKYYMNWGWAGSGNGWFNLVDNNMPIPGMGYNFTERQAAVFGVYPASADSTQVDFLGIPEVEDNTELLGAYPNPATLNVTLTYRINSACDMQIYSIDGKLISTHRLQPDSKSLKLNVSNMPAGIYIYRIGGKSGKFMVN